MKEVDPCLNLKTKVSIVEQTIISRCEILKKVYDMIILVMPGKDDAEYVTYSSHKNVFSKVTRWTLAKLFGVISAEKEACEFVGLKVALLIKKIKSEITEAAISFGRTIELDVYIA